MQKTMCIRIDEKDYDFVKELAKQNKEEVSKAVRNLVDLGRLMFAIERYKKGQASLGRAAELAGISISEMINLLTDFGVKSNMKREDYLSGLENLRKTW